MLNNLGFNPRELCRGLCNISRVKRRMQNKCTKGELNFQGKFRDVSALVAFARRGLCYELDMSGYVYGFLRKYKMQMKDVMRCIK